MKTPASDAVAGVFRNHQWDVREGGEGPDSPFSVIAENEVAVAFVTRISSANLRRDIAERAATVAATLQRHGGPKAWEGYLLVLVDGLLQVPALEQAALQRDLTYCRRILLDAQRVELSDGSEDDYLATELALLFPLAGVEAATQGSVRSLLVAELDRRGNDQWLVARLVDAATESKVNAMAVVLEHLAGPA